MARPLPSAALLLSLTSALACGSGADETIVDVEPSPKIEGIEPAAPTVMTSPHEGFGGPVEGPPPDLAAAEAEGRPRVSVLERGVPVPEAELWEQMFEARAICFGELHPNPEHHVAQNRALDELARRAEAEGRTLAVGFEMFQRPYQGALDAFVSGQIDENELLLDTEYQTRWGWAFELYRPLLLVARDYGLPALALNAPTELTRKIARMGLGSLDADERDQLPELDLENAAHACYFSNIGRAGACPPETTPSNIYTAQVVWDETMADTAASWLGAAGDDAQLIIFAGMGHCQDSAIPERITRRTGIDVLSVMPLEAAELADLNAAPRLFDMILLVRP